MLFRSIKLLLACPDIEINKAHKTGVTPFYIACQNGFFEGVQLLLTCPDLDSNKANNNGFTPFLTACKQGHSEVVKLLLAHPGIENNKAIQNGVTPLYMACQNGHHLIVDLLLQSNSIDVNHAQSDGYTPLLVSCLSPSNLNNKALFRVLLEKGANVYQQNTNGETVLDLAFLQNNTAAIEEIFLYVKKESLSLTSLMSATTEDKAREWASSELLLSEPNRFFVSHPLSDLKQFIQQKLASSEQHSVERSHQK